jgi:hypothetical protein
VLRALLLFGIMDSDSNERLSQKEFSHVCQKMNEKDMYVSHATLDAPPVARNTLRMFVENKEKLDAAFNLVDVDGSRSISFAEFAKWMVKEIDKFDEFFKSFVCREVRSKRPPMYVQTTRRSNSSSSSSSYRNLRLVTPCACTYFMTACCRLAPGQVPPTDPP